MIALGLDTSNYTTSIAWFDGRSGENQSRLLPVRPGELGLRQSDAVFAHVQGLPALAARLFAGVDTGGLEAIGVSTRPRAVEGSYMPCFQVGLSQARTLAAALGVPVVEVAHQQGHLAAALWAAGKMDLLDGPFLAWHLSGGTTELLYVEPEGWNLNCRRIGGTMDISAGQLIDRTGKLLGLPFPAGRHLDELSQATGTEEAFRVKCPETWFSLSGAENQVQAYLRATQNPEKTAAYALRTVCLAVQAATEHAVVRHPGLPVVFSGGVSANRLLRRTLDGAVFCPPAYSTDNAMGPAILAWRSRRG